MLGSSQILITFSFVNVIVVGISVIGPSLKFAVDVPLKMVVMLLGIVTLFNAKLVME